MVAALTARGGSKEGIAEPFGDLFLNQTDVLGVEFVQ
jgi:hypothetical protein